DLMGIYLSDHPFSLAHHQLAGVVDVFCGQINEEMAGQKVFTAGRVVSVRPLVTKDNRQFLAATLEDLEGSIEVTVWSEVYEKTKELWAVGNILHLIGKVRMRDERVQLHCERVRLHQPEGQGPWQGEERNHTALRPFDKLRRRPESIEGAPQAPSTGSGVVLQPKDVALSPSKGQRQDTVLRPFDKLRTAQAQDTAERQPAPRPEKKRVVITLEESQDPQRDQATLREVFAILQEHPGRDEVRLSILSSQGSIQMRAPSASYTPELHSKLAGLVGEGGLTVEKTS
ncbi:MAG: OB-fold nucleic acid binding domain-containing protein, partial [Chloroflexota bacterium]|nr:OB-fold nucleic acid binding domain-containing protein [Chloroflexota bacterium]